MVLISMATITPPTFRYFLLLGVPAGGFLELEPRALALGDQLADVRLGRRLVETDQRVEVAGSPGRVLPQLGHRPLGQLQQRPSQRLPRRLARPPAFDREAYRRRNVVERCINRLKQWRAVATRFDKRADNYRAIVVLAGLVLWLP